MRYRQGVEGRRACLARSCILPPPPLSLSFFRPSERDSLTRASLCPLAWEKPPFVSPVRKQRVFIRGQPSEDVFRASVQGRLTKGMPRVSASVKDILRLPLRQRAASLLKRALVTLGHATLFVFFIAAIGSRRWRSFVLYRDVERH